VQDYKNVQRWTDAIAERPAVKRGRMVNRAWGDPSSQLHERHDASDFDTKTQDKAAYISTRICEHDDVKQFTHQSRSSGYIPAATYKRRKLVRWPIIPLQAANASPCRARNPSGNPIRPSGWKSPFCSAAANPTC
jgi:hypothetical protein